MKSAIVPAIGLAAVSLLIACAPVISQRGYLPDPSIEGAIKTGTDTKTSVQSRLGYASTTATFGNDTWYYISATEKQVAFFTPTVLKRQILAVYFDKANKVTAPLRPAGRPCDLVRAQGNTGARTRDDLPAAVAERHTRNIRHADPGNQSRQRRRSRSVTV